MKKLSLIFLFLSALKAENATESILHQSELMSHQEQEETVKSPENGESEETELPAKSEEEDEESLATVAPEEDKAETPELTEEPEIVMP